MSATKQVWLVRGRATLAKHAALWSLCEQCKALLGEEGMAIGEHATGVAIKPWVHFPRETWTRGRLSGPAGEIQWRTYGPLVRVVILVEVPDQAKGDELKEQLQNLGLNGLLVDQFEARQENLALQTNDDEYTQATVHHYGTGDEPDLFVRYGRIQTAKSTPEASHSNDEAEKEIPA